MCGCGSTGWSSATLSRTSRSRPTGCDKVYRDAQIVGRPETARVEDINRNLLTRKTLQATAGRADRLARALPFAEARRSP